MKPFKLLFSIALAGLVAIAVIKPAQAQTAPFGYLKTTHGVSGATVNDTITTVAKSQVLNTTGYWSQLFFEVNLNKISGTAGGTIKVWGSVDGVNYPLQVLTDTLAVANVSAQHKIFSIGPAKLPFYRVTYTPTGTMSVKLNTYFYTRPSLLNWQGLLNL